MNEHPLALLPEALLLGGSAASLVVGMVVPRHRQVIAWAVALAAALAAAVAAVVALVGGARTVYDGTWTVDGLTGAVRLVVAGASVLVLLLARDRIAGSPRETEFGVLVLLAATGTVVLAGASDLLLLAVGYLLASIPLYGLTGWGRDAPGAEAALKTYLLGALASIVMLAGVLVLAGVGGGVTGYAALRAALPAAPHGAVAFAVVAVFAGLAYKASAVPLHFWLPDAVSGATAPAAAFAATVPKIGALVALFRLLDVLPAATTWPLLVAVIAVASMTLGNLAAFRQDDPRRLLAWSSVSQVGYLLLAVVVGTRDTAAAGALVVYLVAYAVTNLGAFAVAAALPDRRSLADWRGVGRDHPLLAAALGVALLALVGIPPTALFAGKLAVFTVAWQGGFAWLVVVAAVNTVASLFYYLRWLAPVLFAGPSDHAPRPAAARATPLPWATVTAVACAVLAIAADLLLPLAGSAGLLPA